MVEHNLAKVGVVSSNLIARSNFRNLPDRRTDQAASRAAARALPRRLLAKLNEVLDPALALNNPRYLYLVTAGLAATFEDYLRAYFQRPETIKHIATMAELD